MVAITTFTGLLLTAAAGLTSVLGAAVPLEARNATALSGAPPGFPTEGYTILDFRTDSEKLQKRDSLTLYVCTDVYWNGDCAVLYPSAGVPYSLIDTPWNNAIASAGPDMQTTCALYDGFYNGQCGGQGYLMLDYPGEPDLSTRHWGAADSGISWAYITTCVKCGSRFFGPGSGGGK